MIKKPKKTDVVIIMPALNEGSLVKKTIEDCYKIKKYNIQVLLIVDSKITPETLNAAKLTKAKIINVGKSKGKGNAIKKSIPYLKKQIIIQLDADYQFLPSDLPKMVEPLLHEYDVTLGTRYQKGARIDKDSVSLLRLFGSLFLSMATSFFAKQRITDVMAGYKGFKPHVLQKLNPKVNHFGYEAELVLKAAIHHLKILNVPISYKKRGVGASNVSSFKHGFLVLQTIIDTGKHNW